MRDLIVREPFGGRQIGDRITDRGSVKEILDGPNAHHVIAVAHVDKADPARRAAAVLKPAGKGKA